MAETPKSESIWTSDDEANLRAFFNTQTGRRILPRVNEAVPPLLPGGDINSILIRSGEVRGVSLAMRELISMAYPAAAIVTEAPTYPPLEDDEKWNDGLRLQSDPAIQQNSANQPPPTQ